MESMASISKILIFITKYLSSFERRRGDYLLPPGHDIGLNSLRGHSLLSAAYSGSIASGGIPLPHFYHDAGPMLAEAYLLPYPRLRYLPNDTKSYILLCKESTSGMISEAV